MTTNRSATWIGGAVVVALLVMAAGWFLLVSPVREDLSAAQQRVVDTGSHNDMLAIQLASLKADSAKLPEYRAELEALRVQVPSTLGDTAVAREVDSLAQAHGVSVRDLAVLTPTTVIPAALVPQAEAAAPPPPEEGAETDVPVASAPTGPVAPTGLVGVDLMVTVVGSPEEVSAFIGALQEGTARLVVVSGLELQMLEDMGATGGVEAVTAGDWQVTVRATSYVLPVGNVQAPAPEPAPAVAAGDLNN